MKNRINTGQFYVKMGFLGNGRRNLISTSVNTETESHKYEDRRTKIEKETGRNRNISVPSQPYPRTHPATVRSTFATPAGRNPAAAGGGRRGLR